MIVALLVVLILAGGAPAFAAAPDEAERQYRIDSLIKRRELTQEQAELEIDETDNQRSRFIEKHFKHDIDDPSEYDMVINSTYFKIEYIVGLILNAFPHKTYKIR